MCKAANGEIFEWLGRQTDDESIKCERGNPSKMKQERLFSVRKEEIGVAAELSYVKRERNVNRIWERVTKRETGHEGK